MNISFIKINNLSEVDFDDLYERSKDTIDVNWPSSSSFTDEQRKQIFIDLTNSAINGAWEGIDSVNPTDRFLLVKVVDTDTNTVLSLVSGFVSEDGTYDGKHSFSTKDSTGSRNYLYSEAHRIARNQFYIQEGITQVKYSNLPEDSNMYKFIKLRANAGNYDIVEDFENFPGYRTIITAPRL